MTSQRLPVAVIGAGPVGLAAAAHLVRRGEIPLVLEAGNAVGATIRQWAHVRVFSPWRYNIDAAAAGLLRRAGWSMPDPEHLPTGGELVSQYLAPLGALPEIRAHLRLNTRVLGVSRRGLDKLRTEGREMAPFVLRVRTPSGTEQDLLARAVIDASGTYTTPNALGANGTPALGEATAGDRVFYGIPDVLGAQRARYARRRVAVVGSGHSAFNAILDLVELAAVEPATRIVWIVRRAPSGARFGGGAADALPARGALGVRLRQVIEEGTVGLVVGQIGRVTRMSDGVSLIDESDETLAAVDEVVAVTGFRPDLGVLRELRLDLDPVVEAPRALAPLIDPNVHDCGTVPPHGVTELSQPEPDFYVVGMKSYGRAPTFLLLTGYEQVRSVVCALTGDVAGARSVELTLPASGVCSTQPIGSPISRPAPLGAAASCCGGPPPVNVVACCAQDAEAKAVGQEGCGCGSSGAKAAEAAVSAAPCCSGLVSEAAPTDGAEPVRPQLVPLHTLREGRSAKRSCS